MTDFKRYNLDNFIRFLDQPSPPIDRESIGCCRKLAQSICGVARAIFNFFAKAWNLCFGDHLWYSEFRAREVVKCYFLSENIQHLKELDETAFSKLKSIWQCLEEPNDIDGTAIGFKSSHSVTSQERERKRSSEPDHQPPSDVCDAAIALFDKPQDKKVTLPPKPVPSPPLDAEAENYEFIPNDFPVDITTFFHIHANRFGTNSSLEGTSSEKILDFFREDMEARLKRKNDSSFKILHEAYKTALKLAQSKDFSKEALREFESAVKDNQRLLISAGWIGTPGHAKYIEFIPDPNNSELVNIRLYNLGSGAKPSQNEKNGIPTYIEWRGIRREKINEQLFNYIEEFQTPIKNNENDFKYGARDYYVALKNILQPTSEVESPYLMRLQESGICALKSLQAYECTRLRELEQDAGWKKYKRTQCDRKVASFQGLSFPKQYSTVVNKAIRSTAKKVQKLLRKNLVGKRYAASAMSFLSKAVAQMQRKEEDQKASFVSHIESSVGFPPSDVKLEQYSVKLESKDQKENHAVAPTTRSFAEEMEKIIDKLKCCTDAQSMNKLLQEIYTSALKLYNNGEYSSVYTGLGKVIKSVPINKAWWLEIIRAKLAIGTWEKDLTTMDLINSWSPIAELFRNTCFLVLKSEYNYDISKAICWRATVILEILLKVILPEEWLMKGKESKSIYVYADRNSHSGLLEASLDAETYTDITAHKEMAKGTAWPYEQINLFGSYQTCIKGSIEYNIQNNSIFDPPYTIIDFVKKYIPDIEKKLAEEFGQNLDKVNLSGQMLAASRETLFKLINEPRLTDCIINLRNVFYGYNHLKIGPTATPVPFKPSSDFQWKFAIEHTGKDVCRLSATLTGTEALASENFLVKQSQDNNDLRYLPLHGEFESESFRKLVCDLIQPNNRNEKELLVKRKKAQEYGLSEEEYERISHCFLTDATRPFAVLDLISQNNELQSRDYQILFVILLCSCISNAPDTFPKLLSDFFTAELKKNLRDNSIQPSVFIFRIRRFLSEFTNFQTHFSFEQNLTELKELLKRNLTPGEKSLVYAELLSQLSRKKQIDEEETEMILVGVTHFQNISIPIKWHDPRMMHEARQAVDVHRSALAEYLIKNKSNLSIMATIAEIYKLPSGITWTLSNPDPALFPTIFSTDGTFIFNPLKGLISAEGKAFSMLLPEEVRADPHFRKLYPEVDSATSTGVNVYEFIDKNGIKVRVTCKSSIFIDRFDDESKEWLRFIPQRVLEFQDPKSKEIICQVNNRYLANFYTHWITLNDDNKTIYFQDSQGRNCYCGFLNKDSCLQEISRCSDSAFLALNAESFPDLDDLNFVNVFYNKDKDRSEGCFEIELPRLGYSFVKKINRYECRPISGFYLVEQRKHPSLENYPQHAIIQDDHGQQKVLLPRYNFTCPLKYDVASAHFTLDRKLNLGSQDTIHCCVFDVKGNQLISASNEENLHLAQVYSATHNYVQAFEILHRFKDDAVGSFSAKEKEALMLLLNQQEVTGDLCGDAAALRLYAAYLLLRYATLSPDEQSSILGEASKQALIYLDKFHTISVFRFEEHQEKFLLRTLLSYWPNQKIFMRLEELDPDQSGLFKLSFNSEILEKTQATLIDDSIWSLLPYYHTDFEFPPDIPDRHTRVNLSLRFLFYYDLARNGTNEDKQQLRNDLYFCLASKEVQDRRYGLLFLAILQNPEKFPSPPKPKEIAEDKFAVDRWKTQVVNEAVRLCQDMNIETFLKVEPQRTVKNLSPTYFRLFDSEPTLDNTTIKLDWLPSEVRSIDDFSPYFNLSDEAEAKESKFDVIKILEPLKEFPEFKDDPVFQSELKRLQEDQAAYKLKKESRKKIEISLQKQIELNEVTKRKLSTTRSEVQELQNKILKKINDLPESEHTFHLKRLGGELKPWSIQEAIINFARQNARGLHQQNPALNNVEINKIYEELHQFILLERRRQWLERIEEALSDYQRCANDDNADDCLQRLYDECTSKEHFNPRDKRFIIHLAFEYSANILLRKNQVDKIDEFLKTGDFGKIHEMIMGWGKSKGIGPLLLMLLPIINKDSFSYLILPQSLVKSFSQLTGRLVRNASGQAFLPFFYDRSSPFDTNHLLALLEELEFLKNNKGCLVSDSKSLMVFALKFIEMTEMHFNGKDLSKELDIAGKILNLLMNHALPLIDEADSILNVLRGMLCFSVKNPQYPNRDEVYVEAELYRILYSDKKIKALARVSSDPYPDLSAPPLTQEMYDAKVKVPLAQAFIEHLGKMKFESQKTTDKMQAFLKKVDKRSLIDYLTHAKEKHSRNKAQELYNQQDPEVQNILAMAGQMIGEFLRHTLMREHNMEYGIDPSPSFAPVAIPFIAAKVPSKNSQFSNMHVTMALAFQAYALEGVTKASIVWILKRLQVQAEQEKKDREENEPDISIEKTEAWKIFEKLRGNKKNIPLNNYKEKDLEELLKAINENVDAKISFVSDVVLPFLNLYPEQLNFSPHNLVRFFPKGFVRAFTGTLAWMAGSLHRNLDVSLELGNTTKTATLLYEKSQKAITFIKQGPVKDMLKQLETIDFDLFCDAGGYCKYATRNAEVAHSMSEKKPVLYYDENGSVMMFEDGKEITSTQSKVKRPEERRAFLDQYRSIGADHAWKSKAKAIVTIGANMSLRDLEQAVWRLRKLHLNQMVEFVISDDVSTIILETLKYESDHKITYEDIFAFTFINQCRQIGIHTTKALPMQLEDVIQNILLKVLLDGRVTPEGKRAAFKALRSAWFKPAIYRAARMYGQIPGERTSSSVVDEQIETTKFILNVVFSQIPFIEKLGFKKEDIFREIDAIGNAMRNKLPRLIPGNDVDVDQSMELSLQTSLQSTLQKQATAQHNRQGENVVLGKVSFTDYQFEYTKLSKEVMEKGIVKTKPIQSWLPHEFNVIPVIRLSDVIPHDAVLRGYENAFSKRISFCINVLEWVEGVNDVNSVQLLGSYRTPLHWVTFDKQNNCLILHALDTAETKGTYHLRFGFESKSGNPELPKEFARELMQVYFLRGNSYYPNAMRPMLKEWLKEAGPERMRTLFLHIIARSPTQTYAYQQNNPGNIRLIFNELIEADAKSKN